MVYESVILQQPLQIDKIFTIHYFEYMNNFSFPGETHNFWEFLYVDKGEVIVTAGSRQLSLKKDDVIFHRPEEFHALHSNGKVAPNLVVISFECTSAFMNFFADRTMSVTESERNLLARIILEARALFDTPIDDPYVTRMERVEKPPFGCEQMIKIHLEQFLIQLARRYSNLYQNPKETRILRQKSDNDDLHARILNYLEARLNTQVTIEQICRDNLIGRSQLQKLFRDKNNCGIIHCFSTMKIDAAKEMIRTRQLNFTQIADALGYTSVHYFSRQFKKLTGMTPSEYSSSIKKLSEVPFSYRSATEQ